MKGRKFLDTLLVFAMAFALPVFWLMEKITELHIRQKPKHKLGRRINKRFKISFVTMIICLLALIYYLAVILSNPPEHIFNEIGEGIIVFSILGGVSGVLSLYFLPYSRSHGGDGESKNLRQNIAVAQDASPSTEPPSQISMSGACCPLQHLVKKLKEVEG